MAVSRERVQERDVSRTGMKRFEYKERKIENVERRATQKGGMFDSIFKSGFAVYKTRDGDNLIRILPPTWDSPDHYGYDIYVHYGIGPDNNAYLCLNKMKKEDCPLCDARSQIAVDDEDAAKALRVTQRVAIWIIDRNDERVGPQIWSCPWTLDKDISALSVDKRKGDIIAVDHPDRGYDIEFRKDGKGQRTEYTGVRIVRDESPISDNPDDQDEWLEYIANNPLPDTLNFYDHDYISKVFGGAKPKTDKGDREERVPRERSRQRVREQPVEEEVEEERPRRERLRAPEVEEELGARDASPRSSDESGRRVRAGRTSREPEPEEEEEMPDPQTEGRSRRRGR